MVSFRISKKGARYKPESSTMKKAENGGDLHNLSSGKINGDLWKNSVDNGEAEHDNTCMPVSTTYPVQLELPGVEDYEVSFTLSLFQEGYLVKKSTEKENFQTLQQDEKSLHPYDKASEALFSAIETGLLPGDILDDIPCNYINGSIVCEIRDYRKCNLEQGTSNHASGGCAVSKVRLRMSLENVVKDIAQLADDSWTYRDFLEVESRIVKAMHPQLDLSPTPNLDRLCSDPCPYKLNLGIGRKRPLRNQQVAATTMRKRNCGNEASNTDKLNSEDQGIVSNDELISSIQDANGSLSLVSKNFVQQPSSRSALSSKSQGKIQVPNFSGANTNVSGVQNLSGSCSDIMNGNVNSIGRRKNPDSQMPTLHSLKRVKPNLGGLDGIQQQQLNTQFVNQNIQDRNLKNHPTRSQLEENGTQYNASRYPSSVIISQDTNNLYFNQQGIRPVDMEQIDPMRNPLPSTMQWENSNKDVLRKDDMLQKKKSLPSPRVSSEVMVHSPISSKKVDQPERFATAAMLTQRFLADTKRKKVDQFPTKRNIGSLNHDVATCLNDAIDADDFTDEMRPMSTSFVGGNINTCKARVMIFSQTESNQDIINSRLDMTEKQSDGTVLMQYGDADGVMLPNVHYADLVAAQFTKLIVKEKYQKIDDQLHPISFYNAIAELQQESAQGLPLPNMLAQSYTSDISNSNPQMLASTNNPAQPMAQKSQNYFSRAQQLDQSSLQQSQLQLPQLPRSNLSMLSQNPLTQLMGQNAKLGSLNLNSLVTDKTTAHLLTQQQLQQNNPPMHGKMMPGPNNMDNFGVVGLGSNIDNNTCMSSIREEKESRISNANITWLRSAKNRISLSSQLQANAMAPMGPPKITGYLDESAQFTADEFLNESAADESTTDESAADESTDESKVSV